MKKLTPIQALRLLTGMFDPDQAIHILAFANLIARKLDNCPNLQDDFLREQFLKIGIDLILDDKHCEISKEKHGLFFEWVAELKGCSIDLAFDSFKGWIEESEE